MKDLLTKPLTFVIVVIMAIVGVRLFDASTAHAAKLSSANQALVDQYVAQSVPPAGNCDVASSSCVAASFTTTGLGTFKDVVLTDSTSGSVTWSGGSPPKLLLDTTTGAQLLYNTNEIWVDSAKVGANVPISSTVGSGTDAFKVTTNGARWHFGAGASDYASSDGTTVTFAGPVAATAITASTSYGTGAGGKYQLGTNAWYEANTKLIFQNAPTISSGFGTSPSIASSNGSAAFTVNVGTGGVATSGVIGLQTTTNGWVCHCDDVTTNSATVFITKQTASSTTTCTVGNFNTSAVAAAWVASDILHCTAFGR